MAQEQTWRPRKSRSPADTGLQLLQQDDFLFAAVGVFDDELISLLLFGVQEIGRRDSLQNLLGLVIPISLLCGLQGPVDFVDRTPAPRNFTVLDSIQGFDAKT